MFAPTARPHALSAIKRAGTGLVVAGSVLLGAGIPSAHATIDPATLAALPVVDHFSTPENPLSGGGRWTQLSSATHPGRVSGGWSPYQAFPTAHGAFWNVAPLVVGGSGVAVAATLGASPLNADRYFSLWMDIPDGPSSGSTGYELRFTQTTLANAYDVAIVRWQAGTGTVLASQPGHTLPPGSSFALADDGATVSAWTNLGGGFTQALSASDSTFDSGFVGIAGAGNITRIQDFRAGALDVLPAPGGATLRANYLLHGNRLPDRPTAPALGNIGTGNMFAVETVDGGARQVLTFPRAGGLSLPTAGLVSPANHSVAMSFRLAERTGYRRILDFSNGTSDNGLYNLGGRASLYPRFASPSPVFGSSYAHLVFTSADAGGGSYDTAVYVNGVRVTGGALSVGFGLGSGVLRFFKDNTTGAGTGEESAGAVACIQIYDGTLTPSQVGEIGARPSRCEAPTGVPRAPGPSAGSERVRVSKRRRPRAKRWNGAVVVDTGMTVHCSKAMAPCVARGRVEIAPAFRWVKAGSVKLSVPVGARRKVVVRLSRRGARALGKAGELELRVFASVRGPAGTSAKKRRTATIAAPPRPRRR